MSNAQIQALARRLAVLERDRLQRKQPNLGFSTIDGGAIQAQDPDDQLTMIIGQQFDGTNTSAVVNGPTPPQPTLPMVTAGDGVLRVYWDGTFTNGDVAPMDFARVLVYAQPEPLYTGPEPLDQTLIVGGFTSATGGEITASLDPDVEYSVYLVTWTQAGKYGPASQVALGTPSPESVPTEPPSTPTLTVVGMPDSFLLRTDTIAATTNLTYQVSYDGGTNWQDIGGPSRSTVLVAKSGNTGGPFSLNTSYQFRVLASNGVLPSPPPSSVVTAQLDTSKVALVASQLITNMVIAGFALLGEVQVGGANFTLMPPGIHPEDPELNKGGLRIELSDGGLIHLPADGSPATITAHLTAESLNVVNGAELSGASHLGGQIEIGAGINDPEFGPTVTVDYHSVIPSSSVPNAKSLARNAANNGWVMYSADDNVIYNVSDSGTRTHAWAPEDTPLAPSRYIEKVYGVTQIGGTYYVAVILLIPDPFGSPLYELAILEFDSTWNFLADHWLEERYPDDPSVAIGIGFSSDPLLAIEGPSNTVLKRYDPSTFAVAGQVTLAGVTGAATGCYVGSADYGSTRYILQQSTSDVKVYNTSVVLQPGDSWPRPAGTSGRGIWYDGTNWWSLNSVGRIRRLESASSAPAATYWLSYAWVDSDTHTTGASPQTSFTRPKRARINVLGSPAPRESVTVGHEPNKLQFYAATSSGGTKYPQGTALAIGDRDTILTSIGTSGTPAPANNWSGITNPGVLEAEVDGWWVDGNSDGSVGNAGFRDDVDSVPMARIQRLSNQNLPSGSSTALTWTTVNYNRGMTTSGTGVTIPKDGLYFIKVQVGITTDNASGGVAHISITGANHGTVVVSRMKVPDSGGVTVLGGSDVLKCLAGDVITATVFHSNGAAGVNRALQLGVYETALAIRYEGPIPA